MRGIDTRGDLGMIIIECPRCGHKYLAGVFCEDGFTNEVDGKEFNCVKCGVHLVGKGFNLEVKEDEDKSKKFTETGG